jgi:hypothetical protein
MFSVWGDDNLPTLETGVWQAGQECYGSGVNKPIHLELAHLNLMSLSMVNRRKLLGL